MSEEHRAMAEWDAAYVLGALTPVDRRRFEAHLEGCSECRDAVGSLAGMPGLLARADLSTADGADRTDSGDQARPPADLVERTIQRIRRRQVRRVRGVVAGLAAAAVVIGIILMPGIVAPDRPDAVIAMDAVTATEMVADVELRSVAWGTSVRITCDYPEGGEWGDENGPWSYTLVITDANGGLREVASWSAVPGREITLDAATAMELDDMQTLEIRTAKGETVLSNPLHG